MRLFAYILIASVALNGPLLAQVVFPMNTGDEWDYERAEVGEPWKTLSDTLMPNGTTYRTIRSVGLTSQWWYYLRQTGNRIYRYDTYNEQEILFFDFDVAPDSVFSTFPYGTSGGHGSVKLLKNTVDTLFGLVRAGWDFYFDPIDYVIDEETVFHVTDGFGITELNYIKLVGANINGVSYGTLTSILRSELGISSFSLDPPYPNPFNGQTSFTISVQSSGLVNLAVFDLLGRERITLFRGELNPGKHVFPWMPSNLSSGVYFVRAEQRNLIQVRRVILIK